MTGHFFQKLAALTLVALSCSCNRDEEGDPFILEPLSFSENPSKMWEVGYSIDTFLRSASFRRSEYAENDPKIGMWYVSAVPGLSYPYTGQNRTTELQIHASNRWALTGRQIAMEASNTGQYCMLRFKPPSSGRYRVKVVFQGVHTGLSSTDVHVMKNDVMLFNDYIDGYGGDPGFHAVSGTRPSCSFEGILELNSSDLITFAVGYGLNKNHFNDTTGLIITIEKV